MISRAKKDGVLCVFISKEDEVEQFIEILQVIPLEFDTITGHTARCTKCNSTTLPITKEEIEDKVPQGVLEYNEEFWKCES